MKIRDNKWYGYIPDLPDFRDFKLVHPAEKIAANPPSVDLVASPYMPSIYDQGELGSCTGNGIAGIFEFMLKKEGIQYDFFPSRLFIYYNERAIEGTINTDSGASIRDGIKVVASLGVCTNNKCKYYIDKFRVKPTISAFKEALKHTALEYKSLDQNLDQLKTTLADGIPIVFGFTVYDAFESDEVAKTGILNLPVKTESVVGGHCVVLCGYSDADQRFVVRNSWGTDFGMKGYFTMPYEYVLNPDLATDFWVITKTTVQR